MSCHHLYCVVGPGDEVQKCEYSPAGIAYDISFTCKCTCRTISHVVLVNLHIPIQTWDTPPHEGDAGVGSGGDLEISWRGRGGCMIRNRHVMIDIIDHMNRD